MYQNHPFLLRKRKIKNHNNTKTISDKDIKHQMTRFKIPDEERRRKKREKARLRQRKCREKKKREVIDRRFPAVNQALTIDLPLHAIFPCVSPSNDESNSPHSNYNRKREWNSPLHNDNYNDDTTKEYVVVPAPPSSSPHSNISYQLDAEPRTTPIPSVSPAPAISGQRQETQLPKQRYLFSSVTPFSYSCDSNRYRASSLSDADDDNGDSGSSIHRVTPTPAMRSCCPTIGEQYHSARKNHPLFAVDALLSMGVPPSPTTPPHFINDTSKEYEYSGGRSGYHRPPQLPPLLDHRHRCNSSSSFFSVLEFGSDTPLRPTTRGRSSFVAPIGYRPHQRNSHVRRY